jgi:uncharacterized protein YydD (DUF2326 family)
MIHAIGSSLSSFKTLRFHAGLNILLAEQNDTSTDTETRNSSGKSSIVRIVHFLLGGVRDELFSVPALKGHSFWGDFEFNGFSFHVERRTNQSGWVFVTGSGLRGLEYDEDLIDVRKVSVASWCRWLGHAVFGLPADPNGTSFDVSHAPTFRSMFPYFARRSSDIGFEYPDRFAARSQSEGNVQIALSYLFGLDWRLARDFELEREEKKTLKAEKRKAIARRPDGLKNSSAIRSAMIVAEREVQVQTAKVSNFQVADHYEELVAEATEQKTKLEKLSLSATSLKSSLQFIEESLEAEQPSDGDTIVELYAAAGTELPGSVMKSFQEIAAFHQSIADNRRYHLASQLDAIKRKLAQTNSDMVSAQHRRDAILRDLKGKGAFSDLASMQQKLAEKAEALAKLTTQYNDALEVEGKSTASKINETTLLSRLQDDLISRKNAVSEAVLAVLEAKNALYGNREGAFEIRPTANGPRFSVSIDGDRSGGISHMEIFCFDYALFKIVSERIGGPGMLIHDSHLFDPVDSRQTATAIEIGAKLADRVQGQYIVMLNSDEFEHLPFSADFDPRPNILPVRLDDTDRGGLFGIRFG